MTHEVDGKPVVGENDQSTAAGESTFNSIDLLKSLPTGKNDIKTNSKDVDSKDLHLGNLEIVDSKPNMKPEDSKPLTEPMEPDKYQEIHEAEQLNLARALRAVAELPKAEQLGFASLPLFKDGIMYNEAHVQFLKEHCGSEASQAMQRYIDSRRGIGTRTEDEKEIKDGRRSEQENKPEFLIGNIKPENIKIEPLNKTETMILNNMQDAIRSGSVDNVKEMLSILNENPRSVDRVLQELKTRMEAENHLNEVDWEQGTDNQGRSFIRLNMGHRDSYSKSSGGTDLTIGSDGRCSASYRGYWNSPAKPTDPESALREFALLQPKPYESKPYEPNMYGVKPVPNETDWTERDMHESFPDRKN